MTRDQMLLRWAGIVEARSTCVRAHVGAIVASPDGRAVWGYGYNGNYAGGPNACDRPDPGNCGCVHAEANALVNAERTRGGTLYTTCAPCVACAKLIVNAGIVRVVYERAYRDVSGLKLLADAGVALLHAADL